MSLIVYTINYRVISYFYFAKKNQQWNILFTDLFNNFDQFIDFNVVKLTNLLRKINVSASEIAYLRGDKKRLNVTGE